MAINKHFTLKLTWVPIDVKWRRSLGTSCVGDPVPIAVPAPCPLEVEQLTIVWLDPAPEGAVINRTNVVHVGVDVVGPRGVVDARLDELP